MLQPLPDPVVDPEVVEAGEGGAAGPALGVHGPVVRVVEEEAVGDGGVRRRCPGHEGGGVGVRPEAGAVLAAGGAARLGMQ